MALFGLDLDRLEPDRLERAPYPSSQTLHQTTSSQTSLHSCFGTVLHCCLGTIWHACLARLWHICLGIRRHCRLGTLVHRSLGTMLHSVWGTRLISDRHRGSSWHTCRATLCGTILHPCMGTAEHSFTWTILQPPIRLV